jgi:signal transduction histidine kinase
MLRQLAAFSRKQARPIGAVDLNEAVRRAEPILGRLSGPEVEITLQLGHASAVAVAEDDLDQLIATLVFSARKLLTVGGSLVVETTRIEDDAVDGDRSREPQPGVRARLTVTAAGYGVQPAGPFPALDLMAQRCGGELARRGDAGRSSTLQVDLPLAHAAQPPAS